MNFRESVIISAVVLALSGCGDKPANTPGVGAGTSSGVGTTTTDSESVTRDRQIKVESTAAQKIQMPAWPLLVDAAKDIGKELKILRHKNTNLVIIDPDAACPYGLDNSNDAEASAKKRTYFILGIYPPKDVTLTQCEKALGLITDIIESSTPEVGWPDDFADDISSAFHCKGDNDCLVNSLANVISWSKDRAIQAEKANLAASEIVRSLPTSSLKDPEDAKEKIKLALVDLVKSGKYDSLYNQFSNKDQFCKQFFVNASGSQQYKVEFSCDDVVYGGDNNGWNIIKHGIQWFGDGAILGKKIELSLDSAISTGMSKNQSIGTEQSTGASSEARGEAGVK